MKNCVFNDNGTCKAQNIGRCKGKCKFAKDKEQYEAEREKARMRLRMLPAETQLYIAGKYYGGRIAW